MYNIQHNGPPEISNLPRRHSKPLASISALQWAADRANQSYGQFTLNLTPEDEIHIQMEFEAMLRKRALKQRVKAKKPAGTPITEEFIITDDDI